MGLLKTLKDLFETKIVPTGCDDCDKNVLRAVKEGLSQHHENPKVVFLLETNFK